MDPSDRLEARKKRTSPARFAINTASSLIGRVLQIVTLLWAHQYLIRRVDQDEYAVLAVVTAMLVVGDLFVLIFTGGLTRHMVEADAGDDPDALTRVVSSMTPALFVCAAAILVGGAFAVVHIDTLINVPARYVGDAQIMLACLVGLTCFTVMTTQAAAGLIVREQFVKLNVIQLGCEALHVALLAILLIGVGPRVIWLVVASTTAKIAAILIQMVLTRRLLPKARFRVSRISFETTQRLMRFGAWTTINGLSRVVGRMMPIMMLNRFATSADTAAFNIGSLPDQKIRDLLTAASAPARPALTAIFTREGADAMRTFYYRGGRYYMWGAMFLTPPFIAFAEPLVLLYTGSRAYLDAAFVLLAVLGSYPLLWVNSMFYQIAFATGRIAAFNVCSVFMQVMLAGLLWLFVAEMRLGVTGAALAIVASQVFFNVFVMWPMGLRFVKGSWRAFARLALYPGAAPFIAATYACFAYGALVRVDNWAAFLGGCALSAIVYLAVILTVCLDPTDRRLFAQLRSRVSEKLSGGRDGAERGDASATPGEAATPGAPPNRRKRTPAKA
ncbi:MAG: hypothetical protein AAGC56_09710 [Pseudomonadota bacterium]